MTSFLIAALLACPPARSAGYGYATSYQQSYQQGYAAPAYQQVVTQFVPVYQAVAGDYVRGEAESKELREQLIKLTSTVEQLRQSAPGQPAQLPAQPPQLGFAPRPSPQGASPQSPIYYAPPQAAPQAPSKAPAYSAPQAPAKSFGPPPAAPPKLDPYSGGPPPAVPGQAPTMPVLSDLAALGRCMGCHTGEGAKGGVRIFDAPGILADLDAEDWQAMNDAVLAGRMPKGGPPMSLSEYGAFLTLRNQVLGARTPAMASAAPNPY